MSPRPLTPEQARDLEDLFVSDLKAKADSTDDPACILWLALHAGAALSADLKPFDREGITCR